MHRFACLLVILIALPAWSQATPGEQKAEAYLRSVRQQPSLLLEFMRQMPKGADLHNHLPGAVYAENYIRWAAEDGLCLDRKTLASVPKDQSAQGCDAAKGLQPASDALTNPQLYRDLLGAWSMRNFTGNGESAHDHFFNTFLKFGAVESNRLGDMLAEAVSRAGHQKVLYLELIVEPTDFQASRLGAGVPWSGDMAGMRRKLLDGQLPQVVAHGRSNLDGAEKRMRELLRCGTPQQDPGCGVVVRYIYEVHRGFPPSEVFAELVAAFEMATADPRMVAPNLVMPEDDYVPLADFRLHMAMLDYLHGIYPKVRIALHAGELWPGLVPPEDLRFHIRESIRVGHAERIGHGDDVMYENDPIGLLKEMAQKNILVEVCLTSNDLILGVRGMQHPLPMYLRYGVPVALSTDDEGVSRSDLTQEYMRAEQTYALGYGRLRNMARNSLEHAFLPGDSLWSDARGFRRVAACQADTPGSGTASAACRKFLAGSQRAQIQWRLEEESAKFEKECCGDQPAMPH